MTVTDQLWLFLFSALMVLISLGAAVWLIASGSAAQLEGVFLLLVCGVVALTFGVTIRLLIRG
jgi:hypothetical protein